MRIESQKVADKSRHKLLFWCLGLALAGCLMIVYLSASVPVARTIFRLDFTSRNRPVDEVIWSMMPGHGHRNTSIATDQVGNFYLATGKHDEIEVKLPPEGLGKPVPGVTFEDLKKLAEQAIHVLIVDTKGNIKRIVPLHRKDGRLMRASCHFLSVSPSGERWWVARTPFESPSDWVTQNQKAILSVHDQSGKTLQEWTLRGGIYDVNVARAVGEDQVYVDDSSVPLSVYTIGQQSPEDLTGPSFGLGDWVSPSGRFWSVQGEKQLQAIVQERGKSPQVFSTFQWSRKGTPMVSWFDPQVGLYVLSGVSSTEQWVGPGRAKTIYFVSKNNQIHKLFETPEVVQSRTGRRLVVGDVLKANSNAIWMDVKHYEEKQPALYQKAKEYEIIEIRSLPRWHQWFNH